MIKPVLTLKYKIAGKLGSKLFWTKRMDETELVYAGVFLPCCWPPLLNFRIVKISFLKKKGSSKISYECHAYESVDDKSLSYWLIGKEFQPNLRLKFWSISIINFLNVLLLLVFHISKFDEKIIVGSNGLRRNRLSVHFINFHYDHIFIHF